MKKLLIALAVGVSACSQTPVQPDMAVEISTNLEYGQAAVVVATFDALHRPVRCRIRARTEACAREAEWMCYEPRSITRQSQFCR